MCKYFFKFLRISIIVTIVGFVFIFALLIDV